MDTYSRKNFLITDDLLATQGQRFLNYLIDFAAQYVLSALIGVIAVLLSELLEINFLANWVGEMSKLQEYLFGAIVLLTYYGLFETLFARTVGKFITKTVVVLEDGTKPNSATILKRTLCRFIPFEQFSFFGGNTRGWHDTISDTYVVKKEALEEKMRLFYDFDDIGRIEEEV
jgi:uncharacterized RDD family membrane protein YckC